MAETIVTPFRIENSESVAKNARTLINQFHILLRTSQIHDIGNIALVRPVTNLISAVEGIFQATSEFILKHRGEYLYIDDVRVRYDIDDMVSYEFVSRVMKEKKIGSLTFQSPISKDDLKKAAYTLNSFIPPGPEGSEEELNRRLKENGVSSIWAGPLEEAEQIKYDDLADQRKMAKKAYFLAVSVAKGVMNSIKSEQPTHLKKVKRVIQGIVDIILNEEASLLGLTTIKDFDEYTYNHCVNVSILAMTIGQKLGLDKNTLTKLGIAALFHDIGKVDVPIEILNKPSAFTDDEWTVVRRHPQMGVKAISKIRGLNELAASSMAVAFEHHISYDLNGYPVTREKRMPNFFSRIVSIADQYDSMTSARVYSRTPYTPDKALSLMMERSGSQLDPLLFKIFANIIGIYPIGTLVMLDTRELGLVFESNPNPEKLDRPKIILITDSSGKRIAGKTVDLGDKGQSGTHKRSIIKALDPKKYRINLAEYFL
ncbi:MAG: HD domain-containing phosphohydrolase [Nitrospirota bacterium]